MANIKLPKDAEGREIPLDTVALYDDDGNVHSVRRFIYTTESDLNDKWINSWIAVVDDYKVAKPEQMHLTPPDSWEKLEEDLDRAVGNDNSDESDFGSMACAYMNHSGDMCDDCKFRSKYVRNCTNQMLEDVVSRIRELRSDSE